MSLSLLAGYTLVCLVLAITPGPNMALTFAATLSGGMRAGFATIAGTSTGLCILVTIAAAGMTSVMLLMAEWFDVVRWGGAAYLVALGARQLQVWWRTRDVGQCSGPQDGAVRLVSGRSRYAQGIAVSLSNPKVLLFLGAFFPQFVDPSQPPAAQLAVLAVIFVVALVLVDAITVISISKARQRISMARLKALDLVSGILLVVGGLVLATARRP
ncbi:MAG: LysE family translocator [Hyphomicrobiaceae bacterium]